MASFLGKDDEKAKREAFGWYLTLGRPNKALIQQVLTHANGISVSVHDVRGARM